MVKPPTKFNIKPPIKWAGGKRQLLPQFGPLFPDQYNLYIEPFLGGGAVFFYLAPAHAVLIDNNPELINFYKVVQQNLESLIADLGQHQNNSEYYYSIRALNPAELNPVARASRFLYLNKTGFNGLFRLNRSGKFNVPFGRYKNPQYINQANLQTVSEQLQRAMIIHGDFTLATQYAVPGSFVYLDPPYHPLSKTALFTSYTQESFTENDQMRLAATFRDLDRKGCWLMQSNSDTPLIHELYQGFDIRKVTARRAINSKADRRGVVSELVIRNY